MARKDSEGYDSYPKDAYDDPPEGPVGVHRGARSLGVRLTPFAIVIVAAAAAGVLFWSIFSGEAANMFRRHDSAASQSSSAQVAQTTQATGDESSASTSASESSAASESSSPVESASPSQSPSASESSTPEESQQVNMNAAISVVNGFGGDGAAGAKVDVLKAAGFGNATATNPDGKPLPGQTVVWYQNDADLATAQQVANTLGIATVEQKDGISEPIVVVLMQ
ncbi:Ig-like domain-containing protein [Bifidobacterium criceti]|uniref:Cell wall integrity and stress response protein 1 n=1 Tax=Bifidobacterium criceti TaxID=1960969 RepID=A0A2A2EG63_9BIFI|nr:Ig-like domain-containing protein [Bifidobacterium criceti]PAU68189.1 cell wall integrity and stress response protein 1 [Bifidobacterium criceti]